MHPDFMLTKYGLFPTDITHALAASSSDATSAIKALLTEKSGEINHFTLALLSELGPQDFIHDVAEQLHVTTDAVASAYENYKKENNEKIVLTGAEAMTLILMKAGIKTVFAYPGTSELALCNSLLKVSNIHLINGRGDKESAFMAAGASALSPVTSAALLHGTRGLTNAAGAIADVYRNEVSTLYLVGLPSTSSAPFLPPHGEKKLLESIGNFTKFYTQIENPSVADFISQVREAILQAKKLPHGPTLLGLPQDLMEKRWVEYESIKNISLNIQKPEVSPELIQEAVSLFTDKKKPVILVDDFLFKTPGAKEALKIFAQKLGAPIVQVGYTRGPMLFERIAKKQNPFFLGPYDMSNPKHQQLMADADILITIEDRNAYPRVLGPLPKCQKIVITSNPVMTLKNGYVIKDDLVIEANPVEVLLTLAEKLPKDLTADDFPKSVESSEKMYDQKYQFMREHIAKTLAELFEKVENPILVDDSQMFGGLLAESYELFPEHLRVFGDHGAFIGGGMAFAAGVAIGTKGNARVFCTVGDQSFTNAIQSLVAVTEQKAPIIYIVCNNGKSVSLTKQILSQEENALDHGSKQFLHNAPISYSQLAKTFGIPSYNITFNPESSDPEEKNPTQKLQQIFSTFAKERGPILVELVLPSSPEAWVGIWATQGNEKKS